MNNTQYARLVEIVGAHDLGVGITLGAHQVESITASQKLLVYSVDTLKVSMKYISNRSWHSRVISCEACSILMHSLNVSELYND